jgi:hypothetical protein
VSEAGEVGMDFDQYPVVHVFFYQETRESTMQNRPRNNYFTYLQTRVKQRMLLLSSHLDHPAGLFLHNSVIVLKECRHLVLLIVPPARSKAKMYV